MISCGCGGVLGPCNKGTLSMKAWIGGIARFFFLHSHVALGPPRGGRQRPQLAWTGVWLQSLDGRFRHTGIPARVFGTHGKASCVELCRNVTKRLFSHSYDTKPDYNNYVISPMSDHIVHSIVLAKKSWCNIPHTHTASYTVLRCVKTPTSPTHNERT